MRRPAARPTGPSAAITATSASATLAETTAAPARFAANKTAPATAISSASAASAAPTQDAQPHSTNIGYTAPNVRRAPSPHKAMPVAKPSRQHTRHEHRPALGAAKTASHRARLYGIRAERRAGLLGQPLHAQSSINLTRHASQGGGHRRRYAARSSPASPRQKGSRVSSNPAPPSCLSASPPQPSRLRAERPAQHPRERLRRASPRAQHPVRPAPTRGDASARGKSEPDRHRLPAWPRPRHDDAPLRPHQRAREVALGILPSPGYALAGDIRATKKEVEPGAKGGT
jgi:hypothetical protein